jgi:serine/threonine protein phosphatase PrpC
MSSDSARQLAAGESDDGPPPLTFFELDMTTPRLAAVAAGSVAIMTTRSPGKESPNEDAVAVIPLAADHAVLAVADGVGGLPAGQQASRLAIEELIQVVHTARKPAEAPAPIGEAGALRATIVDAIESANQAVMAAGSGATTLAVAEVHTGVVRSYHVGDSTILLTGQRGRVKTQTIAHSPVGYAVESGLLDEREAMVHEDRHLVSNMLGSPDMRIEIGPVIELAHFDTLLVASDGLSDNIYPAELVELGRKGRLDRAAAALSELCQRRMLGDAADDHPSKPDDMSFILFRPRSLPARIGESA